MYVAEKGCVTIDGVSLTVNRAAGDRLVVGIIPHTASVTKFGGILVGTAVNIEVDLVARYVRQMLSPWLGASPPAETNLLQVLQANGFLKESR